MSPLASRLAAQQSSMFNCAQSKSHQNMGDASYRKKPIAAETYVIVSKERQARGDQSLSGVSDHGLVDVACEVVPEMKAYISLIVTDAR